MHAPAPNHNVRAKRQWPVATRYQTFSKFSSVFRATLSSLVRWESLGCPWNRVRKNIVRLRSPTSPAFGLPLDRLANQCKCRRRPGPQLAFQRSRTTSRALNKCRCDRQETQGGRLSAPHLPPRAARRTPPRASAVCTGYLWRLRGVCLGGMECNIVTAEAMRPQSLKAVREWFEPQHP